MYIIREMKQEEYFLLRDFLYEAIFVPDGADPPPRSIINLPELQEYISGFGRRRCDKAFVAELRGKPVGAAWARIMNDYGHIDDATPSLAISVYRRYRGLGIGASLLRSLMDALRIEGYPRLSLSVQKENYAVRMYRKAGFSIVRENGEEYIMSVDL